MAFNKQRRNWKIEPLHRRNERWLHSPKQAIATSNRTVPSQSILQIAIQRGKKVADGVIELVHMRSQYFSSLRTPCFILAGNQPLVHAPECGFTIIWIIEDMKEVISDVMELTVNNLASAPVWLSNWCVLAENCTPCQPSNRYKLFNNYPPTCWWS